MTKRNEEKIAARHTVLVKNGWNFSIASDVLSIAGDRITAEGLRKQFKNLPRDHKCAIPEGVVQQGRPPTYSSPTEREREKKRRQRARKQPTEVEPQDK